MKNITYLIARLKRLKLRRKIQLGLLLVAGSTLWLAGHELSSSVHSGFSPAKTSTMAAKAPSHAPSVAPAQTLSNQYYILDLPAGYSAQDALQTPSGMLATQTIIKHGSFGSLIISIGVQPLSSDGLEADPSYHLRVSNQSRYQLHTQPQAGDTLQIANDRQEASVVAFWPHGGYLATISVSSGLGNPATNDNADVLKALQPILDAWQWQ